MEVIVVSFSNCCYTAWCARWLLLVLLGVLLGRATLAWALLVTSTLCRSMLHLLSAFCFGPLDRCLDNLGLASLVELME